MAEPLISKSSYKYLKDSLDTGWISSKGPFVERFEKLFAKFIGTKHAISTNSGTSAIHLALAALKISSGDEVIVPALTMIAVALPVIYQSATPVLVDVEKETGNLDVRKIENKITKKTKAIIVVHSNGHPADLDSLFSLAKKYGVAVIEDAAEAHGAQYKTTKGWRKVGSIANLGCFSFYANKLISTGEGGMVTTNDKKLAEKLLSLRNLARIEGKHFFHKEIGFAYRMSNLQAALGVAQLEEVDSLLNKKAHIGRLYTKLLKNLKVLSLPVQKDYARRLYWQYDILIKDPKINRDKLAKFLAKSDIETRNAFIPLHLQPAFLNKGLFKNEHYKNAEYLSKRGLSLPSGLTIKDSEIRFVVDRIREFINEA